MIAIKRANGNLGKLVVKSLWRKSQQIRSQPQSEIQSGPVICAA